MARHDGAEAPSRLGARLLTLTAIVVAGGVAALIWWADNEPPPKSAPAISITLPPMLPKPAAAPPPAPAPQPAAAAATSPAPSPPPLEPPSSNPAPAAQQQAAAPPPVPAPPPQRPPYLRSEPLPPAPDPALVERSAQGPLPKVGADGRKVWQAYGRPFDRGDRRPRIALILSGLGQSSAATETAIDDLPGGVTLAFNPYAPRLDEWIDRARAAGHEVLLSLAMEPVEYPRIDPGPHTLLVALDAKQNLERTQWVLSRVTGYVGTISAAGSRFTTSKSDLLPVLDELKSRGLMFVDRRVTERSVAAVLAKSIGLPRASCDLTIDQQASRDAIDGRLAELEGLARQNGVAVGAGDSYPVTIERIARWAAGLEQKGIALAPISAVADLQPEPAAAQK